MCRKIEAVLPVALLAAAMLLLPAAAFALSFGPFAMPIGPPSAITPEVGAPQAIAGSITLETDAIPITGPTLFQLTAIVGQVAGGAEVRLDPSIATAALGIVRVDGSFLIPTLFLRVVDGANAFDLAVPNVTGTLFPSFQNNAISGLSTSFVIDTGSPAGLATVRIVAGVPEPGTALLLLLGLGALAAKEMTR